MCFEDKKNAFNVCYFMIKPRVWAGSPPSEGGHRAEATLSCQTLPEWLPTSDMSLPVECLTPMKQGTRKSGRKAVLKNRASTCTVHLSPDLFLSQMLCLSISHKEKIPSEKKYIYLESQEQIGTGTDLNSRRWQGRNYFSNTFASPGKVVSVVFSC